MMGARLKGGPRAGPRSVAKQLILMRWPSDWQSLDLLPLRFPLGPNKYCQCAPKTVSFPLLFFCARLDNMRLLSSCLLLIALFPSVYAACNISGINQQVPCPPESAHQ